MSDIVERLRLSVTKGHEPTDELAIEAVDEIERLTADKAAISQTASDYLHEIERLRVALIVDRRPGSANSGRSKGKIRHC